MSFVIKIFRNGLQGESTELFAAPSTRIEKLDNGELQVEVYSAIHEAGLELVLVGADDALFIESAAGKTIYSRRR